LSGFRTKCREVGKAKRRISLNKKIGIASRRQNSKPAEMKYEAL